MVKIGRNEPCPCGSGKKYKKCCIGKPLVTLSDGTVGFMDQRTARARENLEKGYQFFYESNEEGAVQYWQLLWEDYVKDALDDTAVEEFDDILNSSELLMNWFVEYPMAVQNLALKDAAFGARLLDYCDTMLEKSRGYLPELNETLSLARAVALSRLGHDTEANEAFKAISDTYPAYCDTYVAWSNHLQRSQKEKARRVLELGLQNCPDPIDQEVLKGNLEYLKDDSAD